MKHTERTWAQGQLRGKKEGENDLKRAKQLCIYGQEGSTELCWPEILAQT